MGLLAYGDTGWGDELFFATLMTIAVALTAIFIGFIFAASTIWNPQLNFLQSFSWMIGAFTSCITYYFLVSK